MTVVKDLRLGIGEAEARSLFELLDMDQDGVLHYPELLRIAVGELNEERKKVIEEAYAKLDKKKNGSVSMDDIRDLYKADKHPDVLTHKRSENEVLEEFLDTFEQHHLILVAYHLIKVAPRGTQWNCEFGGVQGLLQQRRRLHRGRQLLRGSGEERVGTRPNPPLPKMHKLPLLLKLNVLNILP